MEKTIRCPECGENVVPDGFRNCPSCEYIFKHSDFHQQGLKEEDFTGLTEIKMSPSRFFSYLKIIAFVLVLFIIAVKLFSS